ncbi:MAG: 7-cyano-7-deazaguanine synthase QueC [Planctomycetota bacterium]
MTKRETTEAEAARGLGSSPLATSGKASDRAGSTSSDSRRPAVVLLSGGLDSATALALAQQAGFRPYALSFRYGQRHAVELQAATAIARQAAVARHVILDIDLRQFGGSALTADIAVPKHDRAEEIELGIPVTYVPARNTIFLSMALAWAETLNCGDIFIGVNALDYSGYPDCRPEFIEAFETLANRATKAAVEGTQRVTIHAPLIHWSKAEIIRRGTELGVDYSLTTSCYDPSDQGLACGHCDSCLLRRKGFSEAGIPDPTRYQTPQPGAT